MVKFSNLLSKGNANNITKLKVQGKELQKLKDPILKTKTDIHICATGDGVYKHYTYII